MNDFDKLVGEQLETMDELLKLQAHLEKYQQIEMNEKIRAIKKNCILSVRKYIEQK